MNSKVIIAQNRQELSNQFAKILIDALDNCDGYFHIALSGGSTPKFINIHLAENYKSAIDWKRVKIFWIDERCVPPDDEESNYKMSKESLISRIDIPAGNIFRIFGENDPDSEAERYSKILERNVPQLNDYPEFDLILLGMGEDGHTASIFGDSLNLFEEKKFCAATEHPKTYQKRITLTGKVINNAKRVIFLVTGRNKNSVVDTVLNKKSGFEKLPASYINPTFGKLLWMLDEESSSLIKPF